MEKFDKLRQSFEFQRAMLANAKEAEKEAKCVHDYVKSNEPIESERTDKQMMAGMDYKMGRAYFKTITCSKCGDKRHTDLVVEQ